MQSLHNSPLHRHVGAKMKYGDYFARMCFNEKGRNYEERLSRYTAGLAEDGF